MSIICNYCIQVGKSNIFTVRAKVQFTFHRSPVQVKVSPQSKTTLFLDSD